MMHMWQGFICLLPVLLALAGLTILAFVLDAHSTEDKW